MTDRPLNEREMRVYLWLVRETKEVAMQLEAQLRAMQIIAGMEATGMPVDEHFTRPDRPELPLHQPQTKGTTE